MNDVVASLSCYNAASGMVSKLGNGIPYLAQTLPPYIISPSFIPAVSRILDRESHFPFLEGLITFSLL
jgi:hypothetical protein